MQYQELLAEVTRNLAGYDSNKEVCIRAAEQLIIRITQLPREKLVINTHIALRPEQIQWLEKACEDLVVHHKPLAYVLGTVEFDDMELFIEPPILIPRPETEFWTLDLIERIKQLHIKPIHVLDLCTGSGCIALALAHHLPHATVDATDISEDAVSLAQRNATTLHLEGRVHVIKSDLFTNISGTYDMIVGNPPYVPAQSAVEVSVRAWEDPQALYAGKEGLTIIAQILESAPRYLKAHTWELPSVVFEIDVTQGQLIRELAQRYGYSKVEIRKDQYDRDRWVELWR